MAGYSLQEKQVFHSVIRKFCELGISVIMTTGTIETVRGYVDRLVVLRNGRNIKTIERDDIRQLDLERLFGIPAKRNMQAAHMQGEVVFQVAVMETARCQPLSFSLRQGSITELLAEDNGICKELFMVLSGRQTPLNGVIELYGKRHVPKRIYRAARQGVMFMPYTLEDQVIRNISVLENLCLSVYPNISVCGIIKPGMERYLAKQYSDMREYGMREAPEQESCKLLRLYLARLKIKAPRILFCENPYTRADSMMSDELDGFFKELAADGTAVCIISTYVENDRGFYDSLVQVITRPS
jgi:ABC-type sugar transport system ATPase subunit